MDYNTDESNLEKLPSSWSSSLERKPRYFMIGFLIHGAYNRRTLPFRPDPHASKSLQEFTSVPTLMTFTNSTPGNVVLGNADGSDNAKLTDYFKRNGKFDLTDNTDQDAIKEKFLKYSNDALETLPTKPREDLDHCIKTNTIDKEHALRNCFIGNNQVGISHTFINKIFTTNDPPTDPANMDSWGIFIFNNSFGIEAGTRIEELLPEMSPEIITNDDGDGEDIGLGFCLDDIIRRLEIKYGLTREDYLFLFDFTCSIFCRDINPTRDKRITRRWSRNVFNASGFKGGKKSGKKRKKSGKKRTRRLKKKNSLR